MEIRQEHERRRQRTLEDSDRWDRRIAQKEQERKRKAEEKKRFTEERAEHERAKQKRDFDLTIELNKLVNSATRDKGKKFEELMADFFRQQGYEDVRMTASSGDHGADLLLSTEDYKVAVQLKCQAGPVGNSVVRDIFYAMRHYRADHAWIVTTSAFTRKAREAATESGVRLVGGRELRRWLSEMPDE